MSFPTHPLLYYPQNFEQFKRKVGDKACLLGCDLGERYIGLSISHHSCSVTTPLTPLDRKALKTPLYTALQILITKHNCVAIVIGYPINLSGEIGPKARSAQDFSRQLCSILQFPVLLVDERFSTKYVERGLQQTVSNRTRHKALVDSLSAAHLLQGVVDQLRSSTSVNSSEAGNASL